MRVLGDVTKTQRTVGNRREIRAGVGISASLGLSSGLGLSLDLGLVQELLLSVGLILGLLLDGLLLLDLLGRSALGRCLALLDGRFVIRVGVILDGNLILALGLALDVLVFDVILIIVLRGRLGRLALARGCLGRLSRSGLIAVFLGGSRTVMSLQEALIPLGAGERSRSAVDNGERRQELTQLPWRQCCAPVRRPRS